MDLRAVQAGQGATFAPDGIPLHFGNQADEYRAALDHVIVLDRSHEARLEMTGQTALALIHRISTNDLSSLPLHGGRSTIFTNANARILDRVEVYQRENCLLVLGEPGRGSPLRTYLQRNIFYGDDVQITELSTSTQQFDLHGPQAGNMLRHLLPNAASLQPMEGRETTLAGADVYLIRRKPVSDQRWTLVVPKEGAAAVWTLLVNAGARPAGSMIYNVLRVRAGLPSVGRELSENFIPLEVGLWDDVSFTKGCYTGQEIIARMESRNRLAKTMVTLELDRFITAPADVFVEGRTAGQLTSSVTAPDGEIFAIGVIKPDFSEPGQRLEVGIERIPARVKALPEGARRAARQEI